MSSNAASKSKLSLFLCHVALCNAVQECAQQHDKALGAAQISTQLQCMWRQHRLKQQSARRIMLPQAQRSPARTSSWKSGVSSTRLRQHASQACSGQYNLKHAAA